LDYIDNIHYIIYTIASIVIVTCNVTWTPDVSYRPNLVAKLVNDDNTYNAVNDLIFSII